MRYRPTHLYVETSDYCNRSCAFCPIQRDRPKHPPRLMDFDLWVRLVDELATWKDWPLKISLQWIDEPLANPRLFEFAQAGRKRLPNAYWMLQSNGDFMNEALMAGIQSHFHAVVLNFYDEKAHARFERAGYDYVPAQFKKQLQPPGRLRRGFGYQTREDEAIVHLNRKFVDEAWVQWHDKVEDKPRCMRPWVQAAIGFDGTVHVCCRDNHKAHPVGSLTNQSLDACFNSEAARAIRLQMELGRRQDIDMCRTCPNAFGDRFTALPDAEDNLESNHMPYGEYDYWSARSQAKLRSHVALPGFLPHRYEIVVGLDSELHRHIRDETRRIVGDALLCIWVCGSRVMTRTRLFEVDKTPFEDPNDPLDIGRHTGIREFGPDPKRSSDLDLKVLVDETKITEQDAATLAAPLGEALEPLAAQMPISGHPEPRMAVHRVPRSDARAEFATYNDERFERLGRGRLSLEYCQLLFDPRNPDATEVADRKVLDAYLSGANVSDHQRRLLELDFAAELAAAAAK